MSPQQVGKIKNHLRLIQSLIENHYISDPLATPSFHEGSQGLNTLTLSPKYVLMTAGCGDRDRVYL